MKLLYELPDDIKKAVMDELNDDTILYCIPSNIDLTGKFAKGWVVITGERILTVENGKPALRLTIKECTDFKSVPLAGNGYLEACVNGEYIIIARYSMSFISGYAHIAHTLSRLSKGREPKACNDDGDDTCPKCLRHFLRGTKICPHCINKFSSFKKLWGVLKSQYVLVILVVATFWLLTGISVLQPYVYRQFIDNCLTAGGAKAGQFTGSILFYIGIILLLQVLNTATTSLRGRMMAKLGSQLSMELRNIVYTKLQGLSISFFGKKKIGDLMNRVTGDTSRIKDFLQNQAVFGINQILILIAVIILLFINSWKMALMILAPIPFVMLFIRLIWDRMHLRYRHQWKANDKERSLLQDILSGIRVVKAFGKEKNEVERFRVASRKVADLSDRNERFYNTIYPAMSFAIGIGEFFVMYFGSQQILGHKMQIGELIQYLQFVAMIYQPLRFMSYFPRMFADAMSAVERIFEVIDTEPDVKDREHSKHVSIKGAVTFKDVTFGYQSYEPVLEELNLDVVSGEMIGLVGHSGAGKSTVINLLMRFYDVDAGQILIDGVDIRDISQNDLHSQIGVVLQETFLFSGTILDNIRYSKPDATLEEVIQAARIANAHDFIVKFHNGYDTLVGESGQNLSGGERQRIAIARAILHNPRILILDEATASLDIEAEQLIQEAFARLVQNRTTFAIAHRLATLRHAKRLVVIDKGRMAEVGSHDELMRKKGIYYKLVMAQRQMTKIQNESA